MLRYLSTNGLKGLLEMTSSIERETIGRILETSHVPKDAVLVVHSAIKGLSRQGYKAEGIIESMLDHVRDGTLLMPTMTWRTVTPENPVFDELATPSHTGVLTEVFRTKYATHRSLHPTHSVAGVGASARALLHAHHLGNTPVPANSPYGLMRDYPTHILFLGVAFEMCTAIHHPEEVIAPDIYVKPISEAEPYELRARDGGIIPFLLRRHRRLDRDFNKFIEPLRAKGKLSSGRIGDVPWICIAARDLLRDVFEAFAITPEATLKS